MKKTVALLLIIVFAPSLVFAQGALPKEGDIFVGGRAGLGAYGASIGFGGGFEKIVQENFLNLGDIPASLGVGGSIGYSSYQSDIFGTTSNWKYTNMVFLASAWYHADVLKKENIDTYLKFSVGYNAGKVKAEGFANIPTPTIGGVVISSAVGARYFFTDSIAAVAEVGWGFGILRLGLDIAF